MLCSNFGIWKRVHDQTNVDIERRAVVELTDYVEQMIDRLIIQSKKEMERLNQQKKLQNIYPKKRIDVECVRRAIKSINEREYPNMSENQTGGNKETSKSEIETNLREENVLTEVA